jgi:hypothetical protein
MGAWNLEGRAVVSGVRVGEPVGGGGLDRFLLEMASKVVKRRQVVASVDSCAAAYIFRKTLVPVQWLRLASLPRQVGCILLLLQGLFKAFLEWRSCPFESGRIHRSRWRCPELALAVN